jgi:hypothetical protein
VPLFVRLQRPNTASSSSAGCWLHPTNLEHTWQGSITKPSITKPKNSRKRRDRAPQSLVAYMANPLLEQIVECGVPIHTRRLEPFQTGMVRRARVAPSSTSLLSAPGVGLFAWHHSSGRLHWANGLGMPALANLPPFGLMNASIRSAPCQRCGFVRNS